MVPGEGVFKGFAKPWIFMIFGSQKCKKTWKSRMNMVRFWSPELSTLAKWSPKKSRKFPGVFSLKNLIFGGFIENVRARGGRKFLVHCGNSMDSNTNGPPPNVKRHFKWGNRGRPRSLGFRTLLHILDSIRAFLGIVYALRIPSVALVFAPGPTSKRAPLGPCPLWEFTRWCVVWYH